MLLTLNSNCIAVNLQDTEETVKFTITESKHLEIESVDDNIAHLI